MEAITYLPQNQLLFMVSKDEWDTKEAQQHSGIMHCMYSGMAKGTSRDETTLKSSP